MEYKNLKEVLKTAISNFIRQINYDIEDCSIIYSKDVSNVCFFDGFIPDFSEGDLIERMSNEITIRKKRKQLVYIYHLTGRNESLVDDETVITELLVEAGKCLLKLPLAVFSKVVRDIDLNSFDEDYYQTSLIQLMTAQKDVLLEMIEDLTLESILSPCEE